MNMYRTPKPPVPCPRCGDTLQTRASGWHNCLWCHYPGRDCRPANETLSDREVLLLAMITQWAQQYNDANPDVGMGPTLAMLLNDVLTAAGMIITDDDYARVIASAEARLLRR